MKISHRAAAASLMCAALALLAGCGGRSAGVRAAPRPLRILVMDPLALPLSCECVEGYAQRRYEKLGAYIEKRLRRPVAIAFAEDLAAILRLNKERPDLIIGKESLVLFDARRTKLRVRPIARLTGRDGGTGLRGLFVVRHNDPARSIRDLKGYRIRLGPEDSAEKHAAAVEALKKNGVPLPKKIENSPDCATGALAVVEKEADATVISGYALALLEGCDTLDKGALRVVGRTGLVPFVTVFATDLVDAPFEEAILDALFAVSEQPDMLDALETKKGFVPMSSAWPDWRGPRRDSISADVPRRLPAKVTFLWKRPLAGWGLSAVAVEGKFVIVADKDKAGTEDIWRCLDADTGKPVWTLTYPAPGRMDYSNSPRAGPVIRDGRAYLLGAFGHLHCVDLKTGDVLWKRHLASDFGGRRPPWGYCSTPLVVGDKLIVNPGGKGSSLVALDRRTGKPIWRAAGRDAAYASFILAEFGGRRQIVGYDAISLGGWDPDTGGRLWEIVPELDGDFNVPTPVATGGRLFVATENNGSRLYAFGPKGAARKKPVAAFEHLAPDTTTPLIIEGMVFGCWDGTLYCLDARRGLKLLWKAEDEAFDDYACLIGGNGRVLILGVGGELLLVRARRDKYELISRLRVFDPEKTEIWPHPALAGNRLYIRTQNAAYCLLLDSRGK